MEDLKDKDKTIAILRHQWECKKKENQILKDENALLKFELEKLKKKLLK